VNKARGKIIKEQSKKQRSDEGFKQPDQRPERSLEIPLSSSKDVIPTDRSGTKAGLVSHCRRWMGNLKDIMHDFTKGPDGWNAPP